MSCSPARPTPSVGTSGLTVWFTLWLKQTQTSNPPFDFTVLQFYDFTGKGASWGAALSVEPGAFSVELGVPNPSQILTPTQTTHCVPTVHQP